MSLLLMVFYWVIVPVGFFQLARGIFRRTQSLVVKGLVVIGTAGFFAWFLWVAVGRNMWLDHQVREMCAKDGGVKVYETVTLPPERFNKWGQPEIEDPTQGENALGAEYLVKEGTHYLMGENEQVSLVRRHYQVFRRADRKLLGERISYARRGGGLPGPWLTPSFSCPNNLDGGTLKFIFIKSDAKGENQ